MPTFYDPGADAGEAAEAMRGLAHASRNFEHPQDMYGVLGDLLANIRSLQQVLEQLATAHASKRSRAFDDHGNHQAGSSDALAAADELHRAAILIDQADEHVNAGMSAAARIAWRTESPAEPISVKRWVSICLLQGEDADEVLQLIDGEGVDAALNHLKSWDYGDETTQAALENGHVYESPPTGPLEREVRDGDYDMTYSHSFGYVALYRQHEISAEDAVEDQPVLNTTARNSQPVQQTSWFEHPGIAAVKRARGLGL